MNHLENFSELENGKSIVQKSYLVVIDDVTVVKYIKSGWTANSPEEQTFHVIIEHGDTEQSEYRFMTYQNLIESIKVLSQNDTKL